MDHSPAVVTDGGKKKCEMLTPADLSYCKASFQETTPEDEHRKISETPLALLQTNKVIGIHKNSSTIKEKGHKLPVSKRKLFSGQILVNSPGSESSGSEKKRKLEGNLKNNLSSFQNVSSNVIKPPLTERQQLAILLGLTSNQTSSESVTKEPTSGLFTKIKSKKGKMNPRIYRRNERGETPLHIAAIKNDVAGIKKLIKEGVDIGVKDYAGWTALHEACNHGNLSSVKIFLERRASVNERGFEGDTPLHDAVINNHVEIVKMLLSFSANPCQSNTRGQTPVDLVRTEEMNEVFTSRGIMTPFSLKTQHDQSKVKELANPSNLVKEVTRIPSMRSALERTKPEGNSRSDSRNVKVDSKNTKIEYQSSEYQSRGSILRNEIQRKETQGESKMEKPIMYICKLTPGDCSEEITVEMTVNQDTLAHATEVVENPYNDDTAALEGSAGGLDQKNDAVCGDIKELLEHQKICKEVLHDELTAEHSESIWDNISSSRRGETKESKNSAQTRFSEVTALTRDAKINSESSSLDERSADEGAAALVGQSLCAQTQKLEVVENDIVAYVKAKEVETSCSEIKDGEDIDEGALSGVIAELLRKPVCVENAQNVIDSVQSEVASQEWNPINAKTTQNSDTMHPSQVSKLTENESNLTCFVEKLGVESREQVVVVDDEWCKEVASGIISNQVNVTPNLVEDGSEARHQRGVRNQKVDERLVTECQRLRPRKPVTTWRTLFARNRCNISDMRIPFYDTFLINTKDYELATGQETTGSQQPVTTCFKEMLILKQEKSKLDLTKKQKSELDKLQMSMEQEIVRLHTKHAFLTQEHKTPAGVCDILRWQNMTPQQLNVEKNKLYQKRFCQPNKILLTGEDKIVKKYEKLKRQMIARHKHEQQALDAVTKRELESLC